jgi:8-oxo-dGTP diphosphatase
MSVEVHETPPAGFSPQVEVAACYLEHDGKVLLLERASGKSEPNKWGAPAGKLEKNEDPLDGAVRELFEETGIRLKHPSQIRAVGSLFVRRPTLDFVFHMFKVEIDQFPDVTISDEHVNYKWTTAQDREELILVPGAKEALRYYYKKNRKGSSVNSYLILEQEGKILCQLRKNTGYCDGMWSLVAGHVEEGEGATAAMVREAKEEIGIEIEPSHLKAVHVMHRKSNRPNVDIFFTCSSWKGAIHNREPEKCEKLEFFAREALPPQTIDYIKSALDHISQGNCYSEQGWDIISPEL